ncbi:hypothetical protein F5X96DRAFT_649383 [Biscogniauxia mediterranea]|nr:hypothetical protein F5X96DRAFT_649383 [Biscogniauxia mediterranea]
MPVPLPLFSTLMYLLVANEHRRIHGEFAVSIEEPRLRNMGTILSIVSSIPTVVCTPCEPQNYPCFPDTTTLTCLLSVLARARGR